MARRIVDAPCNVDQNRLTACWNHKDLPTKMEDSLIRVSGGLGWFWLAKYQQLLALWEYSHRRDARCRNNARWFIAVSSEGLLWYISPAECLVGVFPVELFFPAKKPQDERREVVPLPLVFSGIVDMQPTWMHIKDHIWEIPPNVQWMPSAACYHKSPNISGSSSWDKWC